MATPEIGNQIGENGGSSSSSSSDLKRKHYKGKTSTTTCVSNTKTSQLLPVQSLIRLELRTKRNSNYRRMTTPIQKIHRWP